MTKIKDLDAGLKALTTRTADGINFFGNLLKVVPWYKILQFLEFVLCRMPITTVTLSRRNRIVLPREAREALGIKPGDKILFAICGEKVLVLEKPKSHAAAIRGIGRGLYPRDYLKKERRSWD
jgi:AbrB family looped-hinge helix DNA binding protein